MIETQIETPVINGTTGPRLNEELQRNIFAGLQTGDNTEPLVKIGSDVLYVLPSGRGKGQIRPAKVVQIFSTPTASDSQPMVQLIIFTDCTNDFEFGQPGAGGILWATSVHYAKPTKGEMMEPGTWHFPT